MKARLEDLFFHLGAENCRAYLAAVGNRNPEFLERRRIDPESLLILNLELREAGVGGELDTSSWMFVAEDGGGRYWYVDCRDQPHAVKLLNNDPPRIAPTQKTLADFLATMPEDDRSDLVLNNDLYLCRTDQIRRSILDPITLVQWQEAIRAFPQIHSVGYRRATHPLTRDEMRIPVPGAVTIEAEGRANFASLRYGRVIFDSPPPAVVAIARDLAQRLRSRVFYSG